MYSKRKRTYESHNVWRSYSDMMAGLLLLFVLVMCISFMQAQKNYQERMEEEAEYLAQENELLAELAAKELLLQQQQADLDEQTALLDEQSDLLTQQKADLDDQTALLDEQQSSLDLLSALLEQQQSSLDEQAALVASQQEALAEQEELMSEQQQKIEQIIGVKADLIAALKAEFDAQNMGVSIDDADGSLTLDSSILFGYNEDILTEEGSALLGELLPTYCKVLMSADYVNYLAEIRIDGYTDTAGTYFYNLQLSQERALAVAEYLLSLSGTSISVEEMNALQEKLTVIGHSWSDPVYAEDGTVDMDASRRVEIKFRLKDEEMINELKEILENAE